MCLINVRKLEGKLNHPKEDRGIQFPTYFPCMGNYFSFHAALTKHGKISTFLFSTLKFAKQTRQYDLLNQIWKLFSCEKVELIFNVSVLEASAYLTLHKNLYFTNPKIKET